MDGLLIQLSRSCVGCSLRSLLCGGRFQLSTFHITGLSSSSRGAFSSFLTWNTTGVSWGGGVYSFAACPRHLNIDHASLSRRSTEVCGGRGVFSAIDFNIIGGEKGRGAR